ncbi:condensation domain-containing protein [Streptomyces sp. NPDC014733]|uniref:condensation domain-containing protein n=1 Tax=Streptomyces sp. NPDC014733 TaxID=3364885 RepID=UPI0036F5269F
MADATGNRPHGRGTRWSAPHDALPLSAVQEAMWIAWQRDPETLTHVVPLTLEVSGDLDTERLRAAVTELARRHPMLRARVEQGATGTRLTWAGAPPVPFAVHAVGATADEAVLAAHRPLDLSRGPLARAEVLRCADRTVVLLTIHHLILDGTSVPLLLDDLRRAYAGDLLGGPDAPGPLVSHARRSWELALGDDGAPLRAYWRTALAGTAPARPLPVRDEPAGYRQRPCAIDPELVRRARKLARELDVTYFTVMFAALFVTLHRHTDADDLIVSAPYHGRPGPALAERVGCFVNVLPYRERLSGARTYAELLTGLRAQVRAGTAHGELPLPAILRAADLSAPDQRDRTHQVVLSYTQFGYHEGTGGRGADVSRIALTGGDAHGELRLLDLGDVADYRLNALLVEDGRGSRMLWKDPHGTLGADLLASLARDHLAVVADMVDAPHRTLAEARDALPALGVPPASPGPAAPAPAVADGPRPDGPSAPTPVARTPVISLTSPTAAALAEIWQQVLGAPVTSVEDSFFEMGGHSLLATTLLTRISRRFGVELSLRELFSHPGFSELVRAIDARRTPAPADDRARPRPADAPAARPTPGEAFPASGFQESIWFAQRLDPVHATYHVPLSWEVTGDLDPAALHRALALLISRHEILRTRFVDRDGRLYQDVTEAWTPDVEHVDLTRCGAAEREARLRRWAADTAHDLVPRSGRLLRAALFTVAPHRHVLAICVHHLVLDGESVPLFVRELERCYAAAAPEAALPPAPPHQYRDLVAAERNGSPAPAGLAYWQDRLADAPSSLDLGAPPVPEPPGNLGLRLAPGLAGRLLPVQRAEKTSAFIIQATAVAAALHRWTGREDLTFGIPVASRGEAGFQDVIGPCLNTLVLRSRCTRETSLAALLRAVREDALAAFEHRAAPFDDVVRALAPARSRGHTPYVDVLLNSVSLTRWSGTLGAAELTPVDFVAARTETSKFPLTITFAENGATLRGSLAYRGDRISGVSAGELADEISAVLHEFGALLPQPVFTPQPLELSGRNHENS